VKVFKFHIFCCGPRSRVEGKLLKLEINANTAKKSLICGIY